MKTLFTLLMAFFTLTAFAQETTKAHSDSISFIYMLDETWIPGHTQHYRTTGYLNFLQVDNGTATIHFVSRQHGRFIYGDASDWKVSEKDDKTITEFTIRSKRQNKGRMINVEITEDLKGNVTIRIYKDSMTYDRQFSAHEAYSTEVKLVDEFWQDI